MVSNNFPTYFAVGDIVCGEHDRHTAAAIWSATQSMEKIGIAVQVVCVYLALLVLTYHLLGTTTSVTVDQRLRRYIRIFYLDNPLWDGATAVASTTHRGSVQSLISLPLMTLSYDSVVMRTLAMKMFRLNTLNSMYSELIRTYLVYAKLLL